MDVIALSIKKRLYHYTVYFHEPNVPNETKKYNTTYVTVLFYCIHETKSLQHTYTYNHL